MQPEESEGNVPKRRIAVDEEMNCFETRRKTRAPLLSDVMIKLPSLPRAHPWWP